MSYSASLALQEMVFHALENDAALSALVGGSVFDAAPAGALPATYVVIGGERVRDRSDQTASGSVHDLTVSVHSTDAGFRSAKLVAAAVCDALRPPWTSLVPNRLVSFQFVKARALRDDKATARQIELTFRARIAED